MASNILKAGKRRRQYTDDVKQIAVEAVAQGRMSSYKASKCYGVPSGTIRSVVKGTQPLHAKMGPRTVLTDEQETKLAK